MTQHSNEKKTDELLDKLDAILNWSEKHRKDFNPYLIEKMKMAYMDLGFLTKFQIEYIDRVIQKFEIVTPDQNSGPVDFDGL